MTSVFLFVPLCFHALFSGYLPLLFLLPFFSPSFVQPTEIWFLVFSQSPILLNNQSNPADHQPMSIEQQLIAEVLRLQTEQQQEEEDTSNHANNNSTNGTNGTNHTSCSKTSSVSSTTNTSSTANIFNNNTSHDCDATASRSHSNTTLPDSNPNPTPTDQTSRFSDSTTAHNPDPNPPISVPIKLVQGDLPYPEWAPLNLALQVGSSIQHVAIMDHWVQPGAKLIETAIHTMNTERYRGAVGVQGHRVSHIHHIHTLSYTHSHTHSLVTLSFIHTLSYTRSHTLISPKLTEQIPAVHPFDHWCSYAHTCARIRLKGNVVVSGHPILSITILLVLRWCLSFSLHVFLHSPGMRQKDPSPLSLGPILSIFQFAFQSAQYRHQSQLSLAFFQCALSFFFQFVQFAGYVALCSTIYSSATNGPISTDRQSGLAQVITFLLFFC